MVAALVDPAVSINTTSAPTSDGVGGFYYETGVWNLPANALLVAFVTARDGSSLTAGNSPIQFQHNGQDLIQVANAVRSVGSDARMETWVYTSGSAQNGKTRVTFSESKSGCHVHIGYFTGVDVSAGALACVVGYSDSTGGGATGIDTALFAPYDSGNRTIYHVMHRANESVSLIGGATAFGGGSFATPSSGAVSGYYDTGSFNTDPSASWVTGAVAGALALELRVTQTDTRLPPFGPGTPVYKFRSGSPWERPIGANPPVHPDNANMLLELNGQLLVNGIAADDHPFAGTDASTTITSDLGTGTPLVTTIQVASNAGFPAAPFNVTVGGAGNREHMTVRSIVGTTWTVYRSHTQLAHSAASATQNKVLYGKAYLKLNGGADGATDTKSFDEPIYHAAESDPLYVIHPKNTAPDYGTGWTGSVGNINSRFTTTGIRIPDIAKTYFNAEAAGLNSDAPALIYNVNGDNPYLAWLSELHWYPSVGKWYCQGASVYYYSSYGMDSKLDETWPSALTGTGVDPRLYQDSPSNGGNDGHRGVNSQAACVDHDRLVTEGGLFYQMGCFMERTLDTSQAIHVFPLTGNEHLKGGYIPEGTWFHIKNSVTPTQIVQRLTAAGLTGARLQEAILVANALRDYGLHATDNSGSGCNLKLQNTIRDGRGNLWSLLTTDMSFFPFADDWEFIADGYDPPLPTGVTVTPPVVKKHKKRLRQRQRVT